MKRHKCHIWQQKNLEMFIKKQVTRTNQCDNYLTDELMIEYRKK